MKGWTGGKMTEENFKFADFLRLIVDEVKRNEHWFPQVCILLVFSNILLWQEIANLQKNVTHGLAKFVNIVASCV